MGQENDDKIIRDLINSDFEVVTIDSKFNIKKLITDIAAQKELACDIVHLQKSISEAVDSFAKNNLLPKMEFTHVREQGLRIWGRRDNIAISRFTLSQILHELASLSDPEETKKALYKAGCKSALQFFADFIPFLRINNELKIPENEREFLGLLSAFDVRSAWWAEDPIIQPEALYLLFIIKEPFTGFPWSENDPHTFNEFVQGYILSLYNCSSEFLRVIHWAQEKPYSSNYAVECLCEEIAPKQLFLKIFITNKYSSEFDKIDRMFFKFYNAFLVGSGSPFLDLNESHLAYKELITTLKEVFGDSVKYDTELWKEINKRKISPLYKACHDDKPENLLIEIKMNYQSWKIEYLKKLDINVEMNIANANKPID